MPSISRQGQPGRTSVRLASSVLGVLCLSGLAGCSPYPDEGEFLAGVIFPDNLLAGVRSLVSPVPASGRGHTAFALYISGGTSSTAVSASSPATSPLWSDGGKRDPLSVSSAQPVYVFDNPRSCAPIEGAPPYDPRQDLIHPDRQYPIFADLPEVLSTNAGRAGRGGTYSAIVEVIHVTLPPGFPCQSVKRLDTVKQRIENGELVAARGQKEYRLLLIVSPSNAVRPMPYQLGWFNQLVVPYIDMGPVPLAQGGARFATMPLYQVVRTDAMGMNPRPAGTVVVGGAEDPPQTGVPAYSPICRDHTVAVRTLDPMNPPALPPPDAGDPAYAAATPGATYSACLVCLFSADGEAVICPFAQSGGGAR